MIELVRRTSPTYRRCVVGSTPNSIGSQGFSRSRIEQMQRQTAIGRQMAPHGRQRPALQIDRQEMLKRPEGYEDAAEAPIQASSVMS